MDRAEDVQHALMLRLLFYTGVRVSELCDFGISDVDLEACKIRVNQGKGSKDRYVLFGKAFATALRTHIAAHPNNRWVFQTQRHGKFTTRRVQQIYEVCRGGWRQGDTAYLPAPSDHMAHKEQRLGRRRASIDHRARSAGDAGSLSARCLGWRIGREVSGGDGKGGFMTNYFVPCQHCGKMLPQNWRWFICNTCGFRVCPHCLSKSIVANMVVASSAAGVHFGQMKGAR